MVLAPRRPVVRGVRARRFDGIDCRDGDRSLIAHVKQLDGAAFIRNGSEHTPAAAEAHLRLKWEKQSARIKTAEDFIEWCATKSSTSGERYRIRMKDGTERDSAELFRARLTDIRRVATKRD